MFFSATTDPESALEIFIHLKANYMVKIIEGTDELINKIGDYLHSLSEKYSNTKMLLMSKEISEYITSISSEFEFLKGEELNDFGAHVLVGKFSTERLNTTLNETEAKKLILSSTREFMGVKVNDKVVSIAAWIREVQGYNQFNDYMETEFQMLIDGALRQRAKGADMMMQPEDLIVYISQFFPLKSGDVIYTGTPAGVTSISRNTTAEVRWHNHSYSVKWE